MEPDRLEKFYETVADACQHLDDASRDFLFCQRSRNPGEENDVEMLIGAWISALAQVRQQIINNAKESGYVIEELSSQQNRSEVVQLEKWFQNVREKDVRRRRDETSGGGEKHGEAH